MEVDELNKCLAKFYVSVRKTDGSYYKKTSLSIRAALDRHLKVARGSFSGSILPKFEHKLRRHKQSFGKIATTVVLDKDEKLL